MSTRYTMRVACDLCGQTIDPPGPRRRYSVTYNTPHLLTVHLDACRACYEGAKLSELDAAGQIVARESGHSPEPKPGEQRIVFTTEEPIE